MTNPPQQRPAPMSKRHLRAVKHQLTRSKHEDKWSVTCIWRICHTRRRRLRRSESTHPLTILKSLSDVVSRAKHSPPRADDILGRYLDENGVNMFSTQNSK